MFRRRELMLHSNNICNCNCHCQQCIHDGTYFEKCGDCNCQCNCDYYCPDWCQCNCECYYCYYGGLEMCELYDEETHSYLCEEFCIDEYRNCECNCDCHRSICDHVCDNCQCYCNCNSTSICEYSCNCDESKCQCECECHCNCDCECETNDWYCYGKCNRECHCNCNCDDVCEKICKHSYCDAEDFETTCHQTHSFNDKDAYFTE